MSLVRDIAFLGQADILSDLPEEQLRLLAFGCEELRFPEGRVIYREGQHADCGFVIVSGSVALTRQINGETITVTTLGEKQVLGEMALLTQTQRLTTAVAVEDASVLRINRSMMRRMLDEHPESAALLHAKLSKRLTVFLKDIGRLDQRFGGN